MDEDGQPTLEDVRKTLEAKFMATGFPTEEQVALTLLEDHWNTLRNPRYMTKEDNRFHEMDILARKTARIKPSTKLLLVIECKKQEKWPWIFAQGSVKIQNHYAVSFAATEHSYDIVYSQIKQQFLKHYYYNAPASTVHVSPYFLWGNKDERKIDPIKEAIEESIDHFVQAMNLEMDVLEQTVPHVTMVYPVIVLNGRLISYEIGGQVKETKHIHYLFELMAKEPMPIAGKIVTTKPIVIDVVQLDYFRDYLSLVQTRGIF